MSGCHWTSQLYKKTSCLLGTYISRYVLCQPICMAILCIRLAFIINYRKQCKELGFDGQSGQGAQLAPRS